MSEVYDRVLNSIGRIGQGERMNIPFMAINILSDKDEIVEFVNHYRKMYPSTWQYDIHYMLGHFDIEDRKLWDNAVGHKVGIDVLYNRSEVELYANHEYVDEDGEPIELKKNERKGYHTSR